MAARDLVGYGGEGFEVFAFVLVAGVENGDLQRFAFVLAGDDGSGFGSAFLFDRRGVDWFGSLLGPWRHGSEVGVVCDFHRSASRSFAQVAFDIRLHPPSDSFDEPLLVAAVGWLSENVQVFLPELVHGHLPHSGDFFFDVQRHFALVGKGKETRFVNPLGQRAIFWNSPQPPTAPTFFGSGTSEVFRSTGLPQKSSRVRAVVLVQSFL